MTRFFHNTSWWRVWGEDNSNCCLQRSKNDGKPGRLAAAWPDATCTDARRADSTSATWIMAALKDTKPVWKTRIFKEKFSPLEVNEALRHFWKAAPLSSVWIRPTVVYGARYNPELSLFPGLPLSAKEILSDRHRNTLELTSWLKFSETNECRLLRRTTKTLRDARSLWRQDVSAVMTGLFSFWSKPINRFHPNPPPPHLCAATSLGCKITQELEQQTPWWCSRRKEWGPVQTSVRFCRNLKPKSFSNQSNQNNWTLYSRDRQPC